MKLPGLRPFGLASAVLCLVLYAASSAAAKEQLDGDGLRKALVGNTEVGYIEFQGRIVRNAMFFTQDGRVRGRDIWARFVGTWEIKGDAICVIFGDPEYDECWHYFLQSGKGFKRRSSDGRRVREIRIEEGNPRGF